MPDSPVIRTVAELGSIDALVNMASEFHPKPFDELQASDFEDAVLAEAALLAGANAIITRNLRDFAHSPVRAHTPAQWIAMQPR